MLRSHPSLKRICSLLLAVVFLVSFAACSNSSTSDKTEGTTTSAAAPTASESTQATSAIEQTTSESTPQAAKELVTLTYSNKTYGIYQKSYFLDELEKQLNIKLKPVDTQVLYAAGESLDINMIVNTEYAKLFDNDLPLPLDDLVAEYGPDLEKYHGKALNLVRKFKSKDNDGKLYFIPLNSDTLNVKPVPSFTASPTGFYIRWDYFKETGLAIPDTLDELIKVLAAMQKAHPKTKSGKNVYGVSAWNDWGPTWNFSIQFGFPNGMLNIDNIHELTADNRLSNTMSDPISVMWQAAEFYFKANQAGLLDKDFFLNTNAEYTSKYKAGQLLTVVAEWMVQDVKTSVADEENPLATWVGIPISKDFPYNTAVRQNGYFSQFFLWVGKDCKRPDRAVEYLNWLSTPETARLAYSGVKGEQWDVVDGKPVILPKTREQIAADKDYFVKTGIGLFTPIFTSAFMCPDGGPADLINFDVSQYALINTPGDTDFCKTYGISYPGEIYQKYTAEGKLKIPSRRDEIAALLPAAPTEIKAIDVSCENYFKENIAKAVLAKDLNAFQAAKDSIIKGMKEIGSDESDQWWNTTFDKIRNDVLEAIK